MMAIPEDESHMHLLVFETGLLSNGIWIRWLRIGLTAADPIRMRHETTNLHRGMLPRPYQHFRMMLEYIGIEMKTDKVEDYA
jgi:hypothetical protein